MKSTCRFAVGERNGLKSSIWTVAINKADIYVFSRLFGSDFKLSLHESGNAQWSFTSDFVARQIDMPNKDRHFIKWTFSRPLDSMAINIFRIQIPHTELRNIPSPTNKKVKWVSGVTLGTYQFDLCITMPSDTDPTAGRDDLPHRVLDCLQLADKRWLVIFVQVVGLTPSDLEKAKRTVISEMRKKNVEIGKGDWISLYGKGDDGVPLVLEFHYDK
ncbi:MAG: hypothetical protein ACK5OP_01700 [Sphingobacteriales bacterium]|jgi:hypothetical protein